jgi:hypothetical protein
VPSFILSAYDPYIAGSRRTHPSAEAATSGGPNRPSKNTIRTPKCHSATAVAPNSRLDRKTLFGPDIRARHDLPTASVPVFDQRQGGSFVQRRHRRGETDRPHIVGVSARTPFNWFAPLPTLGFGTVCQLLPFQRITKVRLSSFSAPENPTAQASFEASVDTANRNVSPDPAVVACQDFPSQCSNRKFKHWPLSSSKFPAAQMSSPEMAVIALRLG